MFYVNLALEENKSDIKFSLLKSDIYCDLKQYDNSIDILKSIKSTGHFADTVNVQLSLSYYEKGNSLGLENKSVGDNYKLSIEKANEVIDANPYFYLAHDVKVKALHNSTNHNEAMISLNYAIELFPDSIQLKCFRGIEKFALNDFQGAIDDLSLYIFSTPSNLETLSLAHRFRALSYESLRSYELALEDYNQSLLYNSDDPYTYFNRGALHLLMGRKAEACNDFRKSADLGDMEAYDQIAAHCN